MIQFQSPLIQKINGALDEEDEKSLTGIINSIGTGLAFVLCMVALHTMAIWVPMIDMAISNIK